MPGFPSMRWLVFVVCGSLAAIGCSTDTGQGDSGGSLSLDLTIADGVELDSVSWEITGGDMEPMSGDIDTSAPGSTASVEVFGIPPGEDYLIEMTADSDGLMCKGSAFFDIAVGEVTEVHVMLNCKRPERFGAVRVDGWFNICAELTKVVVSPLQTSVGNNIDLSSAAVDEEGDDITYMWTGTGGSIADPMMAATTYTCQEVGDHSVTIKVSDDDFIYCVSEWTVAVTCVPSDGDLCEGVTCPDLGECKNNTCNPANGECEESNVDNGTACGDGGMCMDGECVVGDLCEGVTCPDLGECKNNICNPENGECEESNVDNGTACGDGGACMDGECVVDLCDGVTCPDTGNDCTVSVCNMQTGICDVMDVPNGESCMDGAGTCLDGTCEVGDMCEGVNCDSGNLCVNGGTCNPSNGMCEGGGNEPINTPCEDGGVCDGNGTCVACNDASQCPEDTNQCTAAACDANVCGQNPVMDGTVCDFAGTGDGVCEAGTCVAAPDCTDNMDCDDGNDCTVNTCVDGMCDTVAASDGTSCDDAGDPGTCEAGVCVGLCDNVNCDDGNQCTIDGTCNPANGMCEGGGNEPAGTPCDQDGGTECDGAGMCVSGATACNDGQTQSGTVFVGCTNSVTTAQSPFPFTLDVTVANPILGGQAFTADFDGVGVFPEFFLDAAQGVVPGGVSVAELVDIISTVQVRSGATGADVPLVADTSTLTPGAVLTCTIPAGVICLVDLDCAGGFGECNIPAVLATLPNSTDCSVGGTCDLLGKGTNVAGCVAGSQCCDNGFCITGDLIIDFLESAGNSFTAAASGDVLFGWSDGQGAGTTPVPGLLLCPDAGGCGEAFMPDGCYDIPAAVFSNPTGPIGIRVNASGLFVPIQCAQATAGGICASGEGCLTDADCATAPCTETTDVVCPTPDADLISCPIN